MELIALDMKRRGMYAPKTSESPARPTRPSEHPPPFSPSLHRYISRQLSFKSAEFETVIVDLKRKQEKVYEEAATFWTELFECFDHALKKLNVKNHPAKGRGRQHPSGRCMSHYWGCHQRFFRQLCMAMKVPRVVEIAKKALAENKCIVIGAPPRPPTRAHARCVRAEPAPPHRGAQGCRRRARRG